MPVTLKRPPRRWIVVFHDDTYAMRIIAVHLAPQVPDAYDELRTELYVECLSSIDVEATNAGQARRTARDLRDVDRIRTVCARLRADRTQRRTAPRTCTAPGGRQALAHASQTVALTPDATLRADGIVMTALRAGYQHRPIREHHLTFEQYVDHLTVDAAATLYQHAALVAAGRNEEAVAVLITALRAAATTV
ncbi:hypothetical protein [Actinacidiphila soli]|uniref:hypothetical protein n=1 Tax=Actinacidiphila soli TaxID=2487275 RepID=UPI000FC9BDEF|nr:hypothetical protein [Actinacidiphila soli]